MIPALYIFIAMVVVGVILYVHDRIHYKGGDDDTAPREAPQESCSAQCCTTNEVCPSEMMIKHATQPTVYYDDEELDTFKGREAGSYTPEEMEQFRDVLYTLKHSDLMGWEQSVKKRGIMLPEVIKEELISLYNDPAT